MEVFTKAKDKFVRFATDTKVVKGVSKAVDAVTGAAAAFTVAAASAASASAMDLGMTVTATQAIEEISSGVAPFTEPAVIITCAVAGVRLGMKFLKGAAR